MCPNCGWNIDRWGQILVFKESTQLSFHPLFRVACKQRSADIYHHATACHNFEKWHRNAIFKQPSEHYYLSHATFPFTRNQLQFQKLLKELLDRVFSWAPARFLPQMIAKHIFWTAKKMAVEPTTETILWRPQRAQSIFRPQQSNFCLFKRQICRWHVAILAHLSYSSTTMDL
jgi:hypothetical protein